MTEERVIAGTDGVSVTVRWEPSETPRPMIVICPGGGYEVVVPREGRPVAEAFLRQGFQTAVVNYRAGGRDLGYEPMRDLAWAVAQLRRGAEEWCADPNKVAVCGFSAGGHVAGLLGVSWNNTALFPEKEEREACRPNAMILCYPVVSSGRFRHQGSFQRLSSDPAQWERFSLEKLVSPQTPPAFLWHTSEDELVPVQNSLLMADSLARHGVPFELHVFPKGVHGLSLATKEVDEPEKHRLADPHVAQWMDLCGKWVRLALDFSPGCR